MRRHYPQVFEQHGVCLSVPGNGISDISEPLFLLIWPKVEVLMAGNKGRTGTSWRPRRGAAALVMAPVLQPFWDKCWGRQA